MSSPIDPRLRKILDRRRTFSPIPFSDPLPPGMSVVPRWHSRGYVPHFDDPRVVQGVTFRLGDALPHGVLQRLHALPDVLRRRWAMESAMDCGHGACWLARPDVAASMEQALLHHDADRYHLLAWCIMPNHVHVLVQPIDTTLGRLVGNWKGWVAHEANRILGRKGRFWQPDYWDRFIRDADHYRATLRYIENNPVKAGLVPRDAPQAWPWSSARCRA